MIEAPSPALCLQELHRGHAARAGAVRCARVGPQLLATLVVGKFVEAMPLDRMAAFYQRHDVELDRQTLARWMLGAAAIAAPVIDRLRALLLTGGVIHVEEAPVQVLNEPGRSAKRKSTMWVYASGGLDPPVCLSAKPGQRASAAVP